MLSELVLLLPLPPGGRRGEEEEEEGGRECEMGTNGRVEGRGQGGE